MKKKITSQFIVGVLCLLPFTGIAQQDTLIDLIISNLEVVDPISPNYDISYRYQITNIGSITANTGDISVQALISEDQIFNPDTDTPAGGRQLNVAIEPNQTITQTFGATVDFNPKETPYLTMKVDWQDGLAERDEGNNFAWTHIIEPQEVPLNEVTVSNQIIIQYNELTPAQLISFQNILLSFGGVVVDECDCNRSIAVWEFDNPQDAQNAQDALDELEIFGRTDDLDARADVDGNELVLIKLRRPIIGFELNSPAAPPSAVRDIKVYLIDTGLDTDNLPTSAKRHLLNPAPLVCGNFNSIGFNYEFPPNITSDFDDENGHGTFGYRAIIKGASNRIKVVPLKVFNKEGQGSLFGIICAIYHAIDNNADIINISAGYQGTENKILKSAIEEAKDAGIFIVAAAGNGEDDIDKVGENPYYPAAFAKDHANVISVASQNLRNDKLGNCSNFGKNSITMSAPGEKICGYNHKGRKIILSGTSMAAFYVTRQLAIEMASRSRGSINVENVRAAFVNQQIGNCLKDSTASGRCLDVDAQSCNVIFEWLLRLFEN